MDVRSTPMSHGGKHGAETEPRRGERGARGAAGVSSGTAGQRERRTRGLSASGPDSSLTSILCSTDWTE